MAAPARGGDRQYAMFRLEFNGGSYAVLPVAAGSPLGDALAAVAAARTPAITRYDSPGRTCGLTRESSAWPATWRSRKADHQAPFRVRPCPQPGHDTNVTARAAPRGSPSVAVI